jgi:ketosteroid isomerase-like protein
MLKNENRTKHRRSVVPVVALVAVAVLAGCAPQAVDQSAELAAHTEGWENALNEGDIESLVAVYAEDCVLMPPNAELARGQAAARTIFGGMIEAGLGGELNTLAVAAAGDVGFHAGTYTLTAPDGSVADRGKFTEAWRKIGGEWKMVNDIWNSDLPEGSGKAWVHISHEVENADRWIGAWTGPSSRHVDFAEHGAPSVRIFQSVDNPNQVGLVVGVEDMAAFEAWLTSPEGGAAKAEDGVIDSSMQMMMEIR